MKAKIKRIMAMLLFSVVLVSMGMGNVCSAASWKTMNLSSYNTDYYISNTFVSEGDVLLQFDVYQNTSNVGLQANFGTVEAQYKDYKGNWVTADTYTMSLRKGPNGINTYISETIKNLYGTCRLVFTSDNTVRIGGSIRYFS